MNTRLERALLVVMAIAPLVILAETAADLGPLAVFVIAGIVWAKLGEDK